MAKITRATQKQFGASGPSGDFGQFGSLAAGAVNYTKDPATIQSLAAFLYGWASATLANNRPALEDMNSLFFLAFTQICYILQQGMPEWDSGTTYYLNSFAQVNGTLYRSLQDTNLNNNPSTSPTYWSLAVDMTAVNNRTDYLKAAQAVGSTDVSLPSSEGDADGMSITLTTKGTKLLCMFQAPFYGEDLGYLTIQIDSVEKVKTQINCHNVSEQADTKSIHWLETGLTPGSHVVKIRWKTNQAYAAYLQQRGATDGKRVLSIVDLD